MASGIALSSCVSLREKAVPVNRPCGVITDSLVDVQGKTPKDERRLTGHYATGRGAGCWN